MITPRAMILAKTTAEDRKEVRDYLYDKKRIRSMIIMILFISTLTISVTVYQALCVWDSEAIFDNVFENVLMNMIMAFVIIFPWAIECSMFEEERK